MFAHNYSQVYIFIKNFYSKDYNLQVIKFSLQNIILFIHLNDTSFE
jgi:hypothetical protein